MDDIIGFIFISIFMKLIFWGICYATGCLLTPLISLGKWQAGDSEKGNRSGFTLKKIDGELYLGSCSVALIGMLFWAVVITALLIT
jgi:hypothetical protein